jgi:hypothetical protein
MYIIVESFLSYTESILFPPTVIQSMNILLTVTATLRCTMILDVFKIGFKPPTQQAFSVVILK